MRVHAMAWMVVLGRLRGICDPSTPSLRMWPVDGALVDAMMWSGNKAAHRLPKGRKSGWPLVQLQPRAIVGLFCSSASTIVLDTMASNQSTIVELRLMFPQPLWIIERACPNASQLGAIGPFRFVPFMWCLNT